MYLIKGPKHTSIKSIVWLAVISQIACQAVYADTKILKEVSAVATPSLFESSSPTEGSEEFKKSALSDMKFLTAVFAIASHFIIDGMDESTLERYIRNEFRPVPDKKPRLWLFGPDSLNGMDLKNTHYIDNVVYIPYTNGAKNFEIRVFPRSLFPDTGKGEWAVSERFGIRIVPAGDNGARPAAPDMAGTADLKKWPRPEDLSRENRVVVLISGGESPGVNSEFALLAKKFAKVGKSVEVVRYGLDSLVKGKEDFDENRVWIDADAADKILHMPGAFAGTARVNLDEKTMPQVIANIKDYCGTVIVIGGNDHTAQAGKLAMECKRQGLDIAVIARPKTIDRDTNVYPIGAVTAGRNGRNFVVRAAPLPRSGKCVVVQSMGRDMGWLTVASGDMAPEDLSGYSEPEIAKMRIIAPTVFMAVPEWSNKEGVDLRKIVDSVKARMKKYGACTLVLSEGFRVSEDDSLLVKILAANSYLKFKYDSLKGKKDKHGNPAFGELGIADFVAEALAMEEGLGLERDVNLLVEETGYSLRDTEPCDLDMEVTERGSSLAVMMATQRRQETIERGGVCIAPDRRLNKVSDVADSFRVMDFDEAIGTVDLKNSGIYTEEELDSKSILGKGIHPDSVLPDLTAAGMPRQPYGANIDLAARSINSQSESSLNMKRPSVCVLARGDADEIIDMIIGRTAPFSRADDYVAERTAGGMIWVPSTSRTGLSELVREAYRKFAGHKMLNIVLSAGFSVSEEDPLLLALLEKEKANLVKWKGLLDAADGTKLPERGILAALVDTAKRDGKGSLIFGRRLADLFFTILIMPDTVEILNLPVSKSMSGVRKNVLGESLNMLPGERQDAKPASPDMASFGSARDAIPGFRQGMTGEARDEPLIGKGFTVRDVNSIALDPWHKNPEFVAAVEELKQRLKSATMHSDLRDSLRRTLADFEKHADGSRQMGIAPAVYSSPDKYYMAFGTTRTIGLAPEFFDKKSPFYEHRLEVLLHEIFHAWRDRRREDDDIEIDFNTNSIAAPAHLDAMRLGAELFWGDWDAEELLKIWTADAVTLKRHGKNKLGRLIRQWKVEQRKLVELMKRDDWKKLRVELREFIKKPKQRLDDLLDFIRSCNEAASSPENINDPIESRWPVLRAIALLEPEEQRRLVGILNRPEHAVLRQKFPVVDSILLMLEDKVPDSWLETLFPDLAGRNIWLASSEIWYPGGGLGRVMQFLASAMHRLLGKHRDRLKTIEPDYLFRRDEKGDLAAMDYKSDKVLTHPIITDIEETDRFQIVIGDKNTEVIVRRGYNELGIAVHLVRDKEGFYTHSLYNYNDGKNPSLPTLEQFTEFMSRATLEFVRRQEEKAYAQNSSTWKGPILHVNDSQFSLLGIDIMSDSYIDKDGAVKRYSDNPLIQKLIPAFSTHTYPDRNFAGGKDATAKLEGAHAPLGYWDYFKRFGDGWVELFDFTSAGLRATGKLRGWTGCVSRRQRRDIAKFDDWAGVKLVSVTNGEDPAWTAKTFRAIADDLARSGRHKNLFPKENVDYENLTAGQISMIRREAKMRFMLKAGQYFTSRPDEGETVLNPDQETVVYIGRLVDWKCGRMRALTDDNITKLIESGVQVVMFGNVQNTEESTNIADGIKALVEQLKDKGPGRLVFVPSFDSTDQQAVLAATDVGVVDSSPRKEAAGATETGFMSVGAVIMAPPWEGGEGILVDQGIRLNLKVPGEGNILVPDITVAERDFNRVSQKDDPLRMAVEKAYLAKLTEFLNLRPEDQEKYHETSLRLDKVLNAFLAAAENIRQYSYTIKEKEKPSQVPAETPLATAGNVRNALMAALTTPLIDKADISVAKDFKPHSGFKRTTVFTEARMLKALGIFVKGARPNTYQVRSDIRDTLPPGERRMLVEDIVAMREPALDRAEIREEKEITRLKMNIDDVIRDHIAAWVQPQTVIADVRENASLMAEHVLGRKNIERGFANTVIIMRKALAKNITGPAGGTLGAVLSGNYRRLEQDLKKGFPDRQNIVEVETADEMFKAANDILSDKTKKAIILDDGTLTKDLTQESIQQKITEGTAGTDYCLIVADAAAIKNRMDAIRQALPQADPDTIMPFVNVNAMALMGLAILSNDPRDRVLFEMAYSSFTGEKDVPPDLFDGSRIRWLVRALPRPVRFDINKSDDQRLLNKLFALAA